MTRKVLWRAVLTLTGGLRVHGAAGLPPGPCVIVANHSSHADTAALIAALPVRRRPVVAAAADYWFGGGYRPALCQALCAAFPVRRSGGGSTDLAAAARLLASGHDVIVFPEGTRSRDGRTGDFHLGAARLAAVAGAALVPAGISGTRTLLPPGGPARPHRAAVTVRFGAPILVAPPAGKSMIMDSFGRYPVETAHDHEQGPEVGAATAEARERVVALAAVHAGPPSLGQSAVMRMMFTERVREEATGLGLRVIDVDVTMTEDDLAGQVARAFGL